MKTKEDVLSHLPWLFFAIAAFAAVNLLDKQSIDFHARQEATVNIKKVEALSAKQRSFAKPTELDSISKIYSALGQSRNPGSIKELK